MELSGFGVHEVPLLDEADEAGTIAGTAARIPPLEVEAPRRHEAVIVIFFGTGALLLTGLILFQFIVQWRQQTSYRVWLMVALIPTLNWVFRLAWQQSQPVLAKFRGHIRMEVDSVRSPTLFHAVADRIEKVAEEKDTTASVDCEGTTEYNKSSGRTEVRLRYWSSRERSVPLRLEGDRKMMVMYVRGDDVVCGRDQSVQNRECFILELASSGSTIADKGYLKTWLLSCIDLYVQPPEKVVEVLALDQSSTDWVPEWKTRCVKPLRQSDGVGHAFFLHRDSIDPLLADACTWCGKELRIYLITGPPGSGKTELTIWLAGYLRVPVYRLSLNDPRLSDQVFAQLISPMRLRHDNSVIQIDEFQETLARWEKGDGESRGASRGVSMGCFCEVLQGSNSLARGFVVLSGTEQLIDTMNDPQFASVFRRIAITTKLDWLSRDDLRRFFSRFVLDFVPGCTAEEMESYAKAFVSEDGPWSARKVSIDMAKQFLTLRISSFRAAVMPDEAIGPEIPLCIREDARSRFFKHVCDTSAAHEYLSRYPPVDRYVRTPCIEHPERDNAEFSVAPCTEDDNQIY